MNRKNLASRGYYEITWEAFPPANKLRGCLINWFDGSYSCHGVIEGHKLQRGRLVIFIQQTHQLLIQTSSEWEPKRQKRQLTIQYKEAEFQRWSFIKKLPIFGLGPRIKRQVTRYRIYPDEELTKSFTIYGRGESLPFGGMYMRWLAFKFFLVRKFVA